MRLGKLASGLAALAAVAVLAPLVATGQGGDKKDEKPVKDEKPAVVRVETKLPVIAVNVRTLDDGKPAKNVGQFAFFQALEEKLGLVVDSRAETPWDRRIREAHDRLLAKKPESAYVIELPPADFSVDATIDLLYKPTKFYEKDVTNNFEAHVKGTISGAGGKKLAELSFKHYWGETPQTPRDDVHTHAEMTCVYEILHQLFSAEGFAAKVPAERKAVFEEQVKFVKQEAENRRDPPTK